MYEKSNEKNLQAANHCTLALFLWNYLLISHFEVSAVYHLIAKEQKISGDLSTSEQ